MISKTNSYRLLGVAVFGFVLIIQSGCTKKEEQQVEDTREKGKIEQMTDQAADKAVKKIRTPIDKAHSTRDFGDDRLESMDKALQQQ